MAEAKVSPRLLGVGFSLFLLAGCGAVPAAVSTPIQTAPAATLAPTSPTADPTGATPIETSIPTVSPTPTAALPALFGEYFGFEPPGLTPEPFAPGFISTEEVEFGGTFSPDGREFYFSRRPALRSEESEQGLWFTKLEEGGWTVPGPVPFGYPATEFEPFVTPDGGKLYYGSMRPLPDGRTLPLGAIWVVARGADGWADPQPLELSGTTPMMYVTASNDGTLYFTGGDDLVTIWKSELVEGVYMEPVELGPEINGDQAAHPYVAPDGSYIIFDSWRRGGQGHSDLYVSFRQEDGTWTEAVNLGPAINTAREEICASVSPDGRFLFFARFVGAGADIYWVDIGVIDHLRPE